MDKAAILAGFARPPQSARQIHPEPATAVEPEPSPEWTLRGYIEALAARPIATPRSVVVEELTAHGCTWNRLAYAAGLKAQFRKRGKYDQDGPALEIRRAYGRGRNATLVWGPQKWRTKQVRLATRRCLDPECRTSYDYRTHFRRGLCPRCYFRKRRAQP